MMNAASGLATLGPQTPNCFREMNPKIFGLSPHQGEEHFDPDGIGQAFTLERQRREELPFDQGQGIDLGIHFGVGLTFGIRPDHDGATSTEPTAKRHQFADANDNLFVLEFSGVLGLFVFAHRIIERHEQAIAGLVHVLAGDDLVFDQTFFSDVFVRAITGYQYFDLHCYGLLRSALGCIPDRRTELEW